MDLQQIQRIRVCQTPGSKAPTSKLDLVGLTDDSIKFGIIVHGSLLVAEAFGLAWLGKASPRLIASIATSSTERPSAAASF